jgi:hypothetical protein
LCCFLRAEASAEHLAPDLRLPRNLFLESWASFFSPSLNSIVGRAESLGLGAILMSIVAIHIEATRAAPVTNPSTVQPSNLGKSKKGLRANLRPRHGWLLILHSDSRGRGGPRSGLWMWIGLLSVLCCPREYLTETRLRCLCGRLTRLVRFTVPLPSRAENDDPSPRLASPRLGQGPGVASHMQATSRRLEAVLSIAYPRLVFPR